MNTSWRDSEACKPIIDHPLRNFERNDCSVVAGANVLGISYDESHALHSQCGRRSRRGTPEATTFRVLGMLQGVGRIQWKRIHTLPCTLEHLVPRLDKSKRYLIHITNHAIAYVNGEVRDNMTRTKTKARVKLLVEVTLLKGQPTQNQINELWARLDKLEGKV